MPRVKQPLLFLDRWLTACVSRSDDQSRFVSTRDLHSSYLQYVKEQPDGIEDIDRVAVYSRFSGQVNRAIYARWSKDYYIQSGCDNSGARGWRALELRDAPALETIHQNVIDAASTFRADGTLRSLIVDVLSRTPTRIKFRDISDWNNLRFENPEMHNKCRLMLSLHDDTLSDLSNIIECEAKKLGGKFTPNHTNAVLLNLVERLKDQSVF